MSYIRITSKNLTVLDKQNIKYEITFKAYSQIVSRS